MKKKGRGKGKITWNRVKPTPKTSALSPRLHYDFLVSMEESMPLMNIDDAMKQASRLDGRVS